MEVLRPFVELGPAVDDEAEDMLFHLGDRGPGRQAQHRDGTAVRQAARLLVDRTEHRRRGNPMRAEGFDQAGQVQARIDEWQGLEVDQDQLAASEWVEAR